MQYYTKQQLQGAGGYSSGVRVGNWNEEVNLQETKLKELLLKQQEGSLKLTRYLNTPALMRLAGSRETLACVQVPTAHGRGAAARHVHHY